MHPSLFAAILAASLGVFIIITILWEGFETIVLPRGVTRGFRSTRLYYRGTWPVYVWAARRFCPGGKRELFLSYYGPISLPVLLSLWAAGLVFGFALLQWSLGGSAYVTPDHSATFGSALYSSGVTFFTLGYGDITPRTGPARALAVIESGVGFGFLALVIGYLPVLYQAFSRREATISRMDGRASSPPTAVEKLRRHAHAQSMDSLAAWLRDWEIWASDVLESHLSYAVLSYYRSQHEHQSWLSALTAILDTCALIIVGCRGDFPWQASLQWQARMTFAMARHTIIDLAYFFNTPPLPPAPDRLPPDALARVRTQLTAAGLPLCDGPEDDLKLTELRALYEPYVNSLSEFFLYSLPAWHSDEDTSDNWQSSAWEHGTKGLDFHE